MALPYVYTAWTARVKRFSSLWTVIAGIYTFFMVLIPFIYIGYYVLFGGEMDMFAMMAVRSTHLKEIKDFLRTMGPPCIWQWRSLPLASSFPALSSCPAP